MELMALHGTWVFLHSSHRGPCRHGQASSWRVNSQNTYSSHCSTSQHSQLKAPSDTLAHIAVTAGYVRTRLSNLLLISRGIFTPQPIPWFWNISSFLSSIHMFKCLSASPYFVKQINPVSPYKTSSFHSWGNSCPSPSFPAHVMYQGASADLFLGWHPYLHHLSDAELQSWTPSAILRAREAQLDCCCSSSSFSCRWCNEE